MHDLVTFFRNNTNPTYQLQLESDDSKYYLFIYSSIALPSKYTTRSNKDLSQLLEQIQMYLDKTGGGIIIAAKVNNMDEAYLSLQYANASDHVDVVKIYRATATFITLAKTKNYPCKKGEHYLIAINASANVNLRNFIYALKFFPRDTETLILNTLGEPIAKYSRLKKNNFSVNRLFYQISKRTTALPRFIYKMSKYLEFKPAKGTLFVAFLVVASFIGFSTMELKSRHQPPQEHTTEIKEEVRSSLNNFDVLETPQNDTSLQAKLSELATWISRPDVHNVDSHIQSLWDLYFSKPVDFTGIRLNPNVVKNNNTQADLNNFLIGIIKLAVLTSGANLSESTIFLPKAGLSEMKAFMRRQNLVDKLDHLRLKLMSVAACKLWNIPGIKKTDNGADAELLFLTNLNCSDLSENDAIAGIHNLKIAVENYVIYRP
jgi:hypothetical protein